MKRFLLLCLITCGAALNAQKNDICEDSLAFYTYLYDNNIGRAMDVPMLIKIYNYLSSADINKRKVRVSSDLPEVNTIYVRGSYPLRKRTYKDRSCRVFAVSYNNVGIADFSGTKYWRVDNAKFPDSLRLNLVNDARYYRENFDMKAEKARLVENLRKFDAASDNKPIFFATIYSKYKGDIEKYVDDLYSKSIMGNPWRMTRFCRWPSAKKLQKDLSVQFAIGLALYDLWIKQNREECLTNN